MAVTGNGPPANIPPSDLWTALAASNRPSKTVDFPRMNPQTGEPIGQLRMWPLTHGEIMTAKAEATRYARQLIREKMDANELVEGYSQVYNDASACEIIFRACRDVANVDRPAFPTAKDVRAKLTSDEMAVLVNAYALVQIELGPIVGHMTEAECEAWIARLKEGGSAVPLALLSLEQRTALLMHLVAQHVSSPTDSSSAGSPPEPSTETSSNEID